MSLIMVQKRHTAFMPTPSGSRGGVKAADGKIYPPKTRVGSQVAIFGKIMTMASPTSETIV